MNVLLDYAVVLVYGYEKYHNFINFPGFLTDKTKQLVEVSSSWRQRCIVNSQLKRSAQNHQARQFLATRPPTVACEVSLLGRPKPTKSEGPPIPKDSANLSKDSSAGCDQWHSPSSSQRMKDPPKPSANWRMLVSQQSAKDVRVMRQKKLFIEAGTSRITQYADHPVKSSTEESRVGAVQQDPTA